MGYNEEDEDLPEVPQLEMVTESFSEVKVTPENSNQNKENGD